MDSMEERKLPLRRRTREWYEHLPRWLRKFMWCCMAAIMGLVVCGVAGVVLRGEFSSFIVEIVRAVASAFTGVGT